MRLKNLHFGSSLLSAPARMRGSALRRPLFAKRGLPLALIASSLLSCAAGCHKRGGTANDAANAAKTPLKSAKAAPAPLPMPPLPPEGVRGIYLTGWTAGGRKSLEALCGLCDRTEINAMVIDVKDDGQLSYNVDVPFSKEVRAYQKKALKIQGSMYNVDRVIATLNAHHIWPIARIACMRDTPLAITHPELAVHFADGQPWHDRTKHYWLNPYKKEVWDYNVNIALNAIKHGFKEIQFDYVRFPSEHISTQQYPDKPEGVKRAEQIEAFVKYAADKIHAQGAWFSTDIFGLVATKERSWNGAHPQDAPAAPPAKQAGMKAPPAVPAGNPAGASPVGADGATGKTQAQPGVNGEDDYERDMGIGQIFTHLAAHTDYMCPMCYPSHYAHGEFGIANPNAEPYKIIMKSVGDYKLLVTGIPTCRLRPWIQDFTLGAPHYGPTEVKAQIKALHDLGIHEFLLWNAHCRYTEAAYAKKSGAKPVGVTPPNPQTTPKTTASATR